MLVNVTYEKTFFTTAQSTIYEVEVPEGLDEDQIVDYLLLNPPAELEDLEFEPSEFKISRFETSDPEFYELEILEEEEDDEEDDE